VSSGQGTESAVVVRSGNAKESRRE
jgi:hypothetical protein